VVDFFRGARSGVEKDCVPVLNRGVIGQVSIIAQRHSRVGVQVLPRPNIFNDLCSFYRKILYMDMFVAASPHVTFSCV
jgi:hypothetical protein